MKSFEKNLPVASVNFFSSLPFDSYRKSKESNENTEIENEETIGRRWQLKATQKRIQAL